MNHRTFTVAGTILFGALVLGAPQAAAAPPPPIGEATEIALPPTRPRLPIDPPATDVVADPCPDSCEPPADPCDTEPAQCEPPVDEPPAEDPPTEDPPAETPPAKQPPADEPSATPTPQAKPVGRPEPAPEGVPTPNRIETGAGPEDPVNWLLVAVPALVLLALAGAGGYYWISRTDRSGS
ncbi:hypothetical protein [Actinophytocola sp.]|uniref:hypothetical protein n=1 Tax=Actinophytocola sp. TaxID=1872138 RepID=UPI0025C204A4|nr:hypothetical protein [Actinophytocola sp.]